jgi:hypothetical protein
MLFANDKPSLHRWRAEIEAFLATLRLKIHARKTCVRPVAAGIPFLGFIVYPAHRRLKRANGVRFERRLHSLAESYADGETDLAQVRASLRAWIAHAAHGDTWGLRRSLLGKVTF